MASDLHAKLKKDGGDLHLPCQQIGYFTTYPPLDYIYFLYISNNKCNYFLRAIVHKRIYKIRFSFCFPVSETKLYVMLSTAIKTK